MQLIWLKLLEERGVDPALPEFAEYWNRYASSYPWNEYGFFMRNYQRGLRPPVAGCFENYYIDEMGSPIRSEIWACLHPGDPQTAAKMAWKDSAVDHAGGEGTYGEMFWAAVEAAAFVIDDPITLIRIGLNMIPLSSHIARSIRDAMWCHEVGIPWGMARDRIASTFGHIQPCNAVPNHGFTILGWLYGQQFGDRLCLAVNCGYDTDCTGATLGSVLGIIGGTKAIPEKWRKPVGEDIVVHKFTRHFTPPANITELTERTIALAEKVADDNAEIGFGDKTVVPDDMLTRLFRNRLAEASLKQDIHCGIEISNGKEIAFHYGGEPALRENIGKEVYVTVDGAEDVDVELQVPESWSCKRLSSARFLLYSDRPILDYNILTVVMPEGNSVEFTILGPGQAAGFAAGANVPTCPKCAGRLGDCLCD